MTIAGLLLLRVMTAGSVSVYVCVKKNIYIYEGTCLLHFITSVPPTLIASLNPSSALPAHLPVFGADLVKQSHTDRDELGRRISNHNILYAWADIEDIALQSKHNCFTDATACLSECQAYTQLTSLQSPFQSNNQADS